MHILTSKKMQIQNNENNVNDAYDDANQSSDSSQKVKLSKNDLEMDALDIETFKKLVKEATQEATQDASNSPTIMTM